MRRSLRYRPILKRLLQLTGILILVQSIVDYRRSQATYLDDPVGAIGERIFIASIHWNNEKVLRKYWIPGVLDLVKHFGGENVYVSMQESGSWDDSKGALRELDEALGLAGVRRKIVLDDTTHEDEIKRPPGDSGWIQTPRGLTELRRVPYLARLRNLVLEPLQELADAGERFDKILFINDVVFSVCTATQGDVPFQIVTDISFNVRPRMCSGLSRLAAVIMPLRALLISLNHPRSMIRLHFETRRAMML